MTNKKQPAGRTKEGGVREERRLPLPSHLDVWTNDAQIAHTPWDFKIVFGRIKEASTERVIVDEAVTVNMSPQFARRLIEAMKQNLERYEQQFGEVVPPRGLG